MLLEETIENSNIIRAKKERRGKEMIKTMDERRQWKISMQKSGRQNCRRLNNEQRPITDRTREEKMEKDRKTGKQKVGKKYKTARQ